MKTQNRETLQALAILAKIKLHAIGNPIKSRELELEFSMSTDQVWKTINTLREGGEPIGSGSLGYFYARTYREIEGTENDLKSRAMSMLHMAKKIVEPFRNEQQTIL